MDPVEYPHQNSPRFLPCGDSAVSVEFGRDIDRPINDRVQALFRGLQQVPFPGLVDLIPSYRSLLVQYDPTVISWEEIKNRLGASCRVLEETARGGELPIVEIPVCYGGDFGPDLLEVASRLGLSSEEVIAIHSEALYYIYMIGFTPGFPFLGGLDPRLFIPRKKIPRERVPAGSVGLADRQTGIYSLDSPGGWQLIGRTPIRLFDLNRPNPIYLQAGQRLRFKPLSVREFEDYPSH